MSDLSRFEEFKIYNQENFNSVIKFYFNQKFDRSLSVLEKIYKIQNFMMC